MQNVTLFSAGALTELINIKNLVLATVGVQHFEWKIYESAEVLPKTVSCLFVTT